MKKIKVMIYTVRSQTRIEISILIVCFLNNARNNLMYEGN
jgi:hypothetical protein